MVDNEKSEEWWDADSMIWQAASLQRVAKKLERNGREHPKSEPLLLHGKILAVPILL